MFPPFARNLSSFVGDVDLGEPNMAAPGMCPLWDSAESGMRLEWSNPRVRITMPNDSHQRAAEFHELAAHAHRAAAAHHGKEDHLTGHEHSKQALEHANKAFQWSQEAHGKSAKAAGKA